MCQPETVTKIGVIGTGTIASAMVRGLHAAPSFGGSIVLSPRNASVTAELSAEFPAIAVGESNQDVLDRSDVVLITLRPQTAEDVISSLCFRPEHRIISAVAALSRQRLLELVAPATVVVKAIPLPTVAQRSGITALFPNDTFAIDFFNYLGTALPVADESQFQAMSACTAIVASYALFAEIAASWLSAQGVQSLAARSYVNSLVAEIVETGNLPSKSFAEIAESHATKGGLNEQLRVFLEEKGAFGFVSEGLDRVLARVAGATPSVFGTRR